MQTEKKQEWVTPKLTQFGDVVELTEANAKFGGTGDSLAACALDPWVSGVKKPN